MIEPMKEKLVAELLMEIKRLVNITGHSYDINEYLDRILCFQSFLSRDRNGENTQHNVIKAAIESFGNYDFILGIVIFYV